MVITSHWGRPRNAAVSRRARHAHAPPIRSARLGSHTRVASRTAHATRLRAMGRGVVAARAAVLALVVAGCCAPFARAVPVVDPDMGVVAELAAVWNSTAACKTWIRGRDCNTFTGLRCDAQGHAVAIDVQGVSTIPERIVQLEHMTSLSITQSRLGGNFPPAILSMPSLKHLKLSACFLHGPLWWHFNQTNSSALETINLSTNMFFGPIPDAISRITSLRHLDLSYNMLSGRVPAALGTLKDLTSLDVYMNYLEELPSTLTAITALKHLSMGANEWKQPVPAFLGDLSNLEVLMLDYTHMTGSLPSELSRLKKLTDWHMTYSWWVGQLPEWIGTMTSLTVLNFHRSYMNSTIPTAIGNLSNLAHLHLGLNMLVGTIPRSFGSLTNLESLDLQRNQLSFSIPASFSRLSRLSSLDLSYNGLSRPIPSALGRLTNLGKLNVKRNRLAGKIPTSLGRLTRLTFLDLSDNRLGRTIPDALSALSNLHYLDLSHNRLIGTIPAALSALSGLGFLDVSNNELVGRVPSLRLMKSLWHVGADHNFLTGIAGTSLADIHLLCNDKFRLSLGSNCMGNSTVLCGRAQIQRSKYECESLCWSYDDTPYCSGHGFCYTDYEKIGWQCACYEGYTEGTAAGTCIPESST
ncbi:unnamed protein product [Closterium sp. NIES-65]|nr:unnamed protein product [Closterium sp. NIES-65]